MSSQFFLILKRGLYYRHNSQGYTGIKAEAGRYSAKDAIAISHPNGLGGPRDGMSIIPEDEAPEFSPECCISIKAQALQADRDKLKEQMKDWQASQQYRYIGRDGKPVLARDLEARLEKLEADLKSAASANPMTATEILLRREIGQLERELEEARKDIEFLQSGKDDVRDGLQAALTAQMALADLLFRRLLIFKDTKFWVQSDDDDLNAYRKARGL